MGVMLKGKKVLVTGAGLGIGKTIALTAAREGAFVIAADIDSASAESTARVIALSGGEALAMGLDVSDYAAVEQAAKSLSGHERLPDVLVNNAATWTIKPFLETVPADWERDLKVALIGTLVCCRVFLPFMVERGRGSIVNIGSDAARVGEAGWAVYSSAKGAVISFTKSLAREVGRSGVRVNAVCPGTTRTEKVKAFLPEENQAKAARMYPLGRLAEPEEVAEAVVFLASERASFITGQVVSVSGGYTMAS